MQYWKSYIDKNGYTYSCDNIRLRLEFSEKKINFLMQYITNPDRFDIECSNPCFAAFRYKYLVNFKYNASSMTLGIGLNGLSREDNFMGFLEFNPNKLWLEVKFHDDFNAILSICCYEIVRFDLAIDVPLPRNYITAVRDNRTYKLIQNSNLDKTEYFGKRSSAGYVKIYNKTMESELNYDLTRIEITLDDISHISDQVNKWLPELYIMNPQQELLPEKSELSNTQLVLAELIYQSGTPDVYLKKIENYNIRNKIKNYIFQNCSKLELDSKKILGLMSDIRKLLPDL